MRKFLQIVLKIILARLKGHVGIAKKAFLTGLTVGAVVGAVGGGVLAWLILG